MFVPKLLLASLVIALVHGYDRVGNRTVIVSAIPRNWFIAREVCSSYSRRLLEIHTPDENADAQKLLEKYQLTDAWIGANDLGVHDQFYWTTGQMILNEFWAPGSYDQQGENQDCVAIAVSPKHPKNWYDRECENKYPFICQ